MSREYLEAVKQGKYDNVIYNNWASDVKKAEESYNKYLNSTGTEYNTNYSIYDNWFKSLRQRGQKIQQMVSSGEIKVDNDRTKDYLDYLDKAQKSVSEVKTFYDQFKDKDQFYEWSYNSKYDGKRVIDVDNALEKLKNKTDDSSKREYEWLSRNRDSFMTTDELKNVIRDLEEKTGELKSDKRKKTFDAVVSAVTNSIAGNGQDLDIQGSLSKAKDAETENQEKLDRYKRMLAEREDVSIDELESRYKDADKSIFNILSPDYSYADYTNDKADKRIFGSEYKKRKNEENFQIISENKEEFDEDAAIVQGVIYRKKGASDIASSSLGGSLSNILNSKQREEEIFNTDPEIQAIVKKWSDKGYDFNSLYETFKENSNANYTEFMKEKAAEETKNNPVLSNITSVGTNLIGGISALPEAVSTGLKDLMSDDIITMDTNSPEWGLKHYTDTVRGTTSEIISENNPGIKGEFFNLLYQTGMSTADFLSTAAVTGFAEPATLLIMGSNAAIDTMKNVTNNGGSASDALLMGALTGLFEALCEKVSVEAVFKSVGTTTGKEWLYNLFKGMVSEGSEELATDLLNTTVDTLLNADQSEFKQNVYAYMRDGMSASEANAKVFADKVKEMGMSFAGGALSGGVMSGGGGALGLASANRAYSNIGSDVQSAEGGTDAVMQLARELVAQGQDEDGKLAYDIKKSEKNSGNVNVGRMFTDVQSAINMQSESILKTEMIDGIKDRVETLGLDSSTSQKAAEIIYKAYSGEKLTVRQQSILDNNKYVQRAYKELLASESETGRENYSTEWVDEVQTRAVAKVNEAQSGLNSVQVKMTDAKVKNTAASATTTKTETVSDDKTPANMTEEEAEKKTAKIAGTDENVTINKIVEKTDGGVIAETTDGQEVFIGTEKSSTEDLETVVFEDMEMNKAVIYASNYESTETANAFIKTVAQSDISNVTEFQKDFNAVYKQGMNGEELNTEGLSITKAQAEIAYTSGQYDSAVAPISTRVRVTGSNINEIIQNNSFESGITRLDRKQKLTHKQEAQLKVLDAFGKKHGLSFITVNMLGNDVAAANGAYYGDNKIVISLGSEAGAYLSVAGHEVYHYLEEVSPEAAQGLRQFVINYLKNVSDKYDYDARFEELAKRYGTENVDEIESEMTANAMFEVLNNEQTIKELAHENPSLLEKIRDALQKFIKELKDVIKSLAWDERAALDKQVEMLDAIRYMFNEALKSVDANKNTARADGKVKHSFSSITNTFFGNPDMTAAEMENADYKNSEGYKNYVQLCINNMRQTHTDFNEVEARLEVEKSIDGIIKVAIAAKQAGYDIYDSDVKRDKRDSKKRLLFSSLEPNSEYTTSSDISTICDKSKNFTAIYDEIVRLEEKSGVPKGKRFFDKIDNYFYLHKVLAEKGLTQPCRQCYVDSMRKNLAPMANAFIELIQEKDVNNKSNPQLYNISGKHKGDVKTNNAKLRENVLAILEEDGMSADALTTEMLTTENGLVELRLEHPMLYEAFNSFYGQSKPKMPKSATPFRFGELTALMINEKGEIKRGLVDKIRSTGGFRLQSYSDFQIDNFVDVLQVLFEAGTLGLNAHAYTKVPAFLEATEGTNLKRNVSIFMYKDGADWRIDKNDSFPGELEEIYDIVNSDKSGNTSIIAVSQNSDMSAWVMANDNIGYGIPFHKSGHKMGTVRDTDVVTDDNRIVKGYKNAIDHTKQQTEVWADTTADHKINTKVPKAINIYEFWDFKNDANLSKKELIEKNVSKYIDKCDEYGYLPKFRDYVINNDKMLEDVLRYSKELGYADSTADVNDISFEYGGYRIPYGYYKFLGDFGMFTPDGKASASDIISLANYNFDKAVEFFADAASLRRNEILQQFSNGSEREQMRNSDMTSEELENIISDKRTEIAGRIVRRNSSGKLPKMSLQALNSEYMSAVENGDTETAQKYVDEAAARAGYTIRAYHGTGRGDRVGNVFLPERATSGPMAYFTSSKDIAESYAHDKADTSLAYDEMYDDYTTQFRVIHDGENISVSDYWNKLPFSKKLEIKEKAKHVTFDDDAENIIYDNNVNYGSGGFDAYRINSNKGNILAALTEEWLIDGQLYGEEHKFLDVLKLVGINDVKYYNPNERHEKVYDTYLKIENPFRTEDADASFAELLLEWYENQPEDKYEVESEDADMWDKNNRTAAEWVEDKLMDDIRNGTSHAWTSIPDAVTDYLKSLGHDGIFDIGGKNGGESHAVYVPFSSEQIKSAEAITYDDNGEIIPLDKRFDKSKPDIRFSLQETSDAAKAREELLKANDNLRVANTVLKNELKTTHGKSISIKDAEKIAKQLLREFNSKYDSALLTESIYNIFRYYDSEDNNPDYVIDYLTTVAKDVVAKSEALDSTLYDEYADLRKTIRNMKFALPDHVLRQLNENHDGKFKQKTFGKMRLVSKESNPDVMYLSAMYSELAEEYPNFFSVEDNEYEQPQKLLDFWEAVQPSYSDGLTEMGFKSDSEAAVSFAYMVFDKYLDTPSYKTFADKKEKQLESVRKEFSRNLTEAKKKFRAERDEKVEKVKEYYRERMTTERIQRQYTKHKEVMRNDIIRKVRRLGNMLTKATDQKHIPEHLKEMTTKFLNLFTNDSIVFDDNVMTTIKDMYYSMGEDQTGEFESVAQYYDPDIYNDLRAMADSFRSIENGQRLAKLDGPDLQRIQYVTDHFCFIIENANEIFAEGKRQSFGKIVTDIVSELNAQESEKVRKLFNATSWNSTPYYFFKRIGGTLQKLYNDLIDGQHKYGLLVAEAKGHMDKLHEKYNVNKWIKSDNKIIEFTGEDGEKLGLTVDEALGIYAVSRREATSSNDSKHLTEGGIVFTDKKNKGARKTLSVEEQQQIANALTEEQRAYAEEVVKYLSTTVGGWGNEASMRMFGYKKFNEDRYYPFHTDENYKKGKDDKDAGTSNVVSLIKNKSFTHSTVKGAATPIKVENFSDVVGTHIVEMISYNTMAQAQSTMNAVYNYTKGNTSVRASLEKGYGEQAKKYVNALIKDISSGATYDPNEGFANKMISRFKMNSVAANLSVIVQQPSAVGRALAQIDPKHFLTTSPRNGYEECKKYSGVAVIKEVGGFDTSTGVSSAEWIMRTDPEGIKEKTKEFFNPKDSTYRNDVFGWAAGKADELTWAYIWQACKAEYADKNGIKNPKNLSEEQLKEVGKRFNEVIEATQVYDSVLTRSQFMRGKTVWVKMASAFMAEPTKRINMLYDAAYEFSVNKNKENGKYLMRTIGSVIVATLINATIKSFITAGRDDDENQAFMEKYSEALTDNFFSEMSIMQGLPIVKDVISYFQGYDISRTDMDIIETAVSSVEKFASLFDDSFALLSEDEKSKKIYQTITDMFGSIGAFAGIPLKNIIRDCNMLVSTVQSATDDKKPTKEGLRFSTVDALIGLLDNRVYNPLDGLRINEKDLFKDMVNGSEEDFSAHWDEYQAYLIYSGKNEDKAFKAVRANVKEQIKMNLFKENITDAEAEKYLNEYLGYDDGYWIVKEWHFNADEANEGISFSKYLSLEKAVLAGEDIADEVKELTEHVTKETAVRNKVTSIIQDAFNNDEITEEKAQELLQKYKGFASKQSITSNPIDEDKDINRLVDSWVGNKDLPDDQYYTAFDALEEAVIEGLSIETAKEKLYSLEYNDSDINSRIRETIKEAMLDGSITTTDARSKLMKYTDIEYEDAEDKVAFWNFQKQNPESKLSETGAIKYLEAKESGITLKVFEEYYSQVTEIESDKDANGKTITGSKRDKILKLINSLPLSSKQKDVLYYQNNYSAKTLYNTPWH